LFQIQCQHRFWSSTQIDFSRLSSPLPASPPQQTQEAVGHPLLQQRHRPRLPTSTSTPTAAAATRNVNHESTFFASFASGSFAGSFCRHRCFGQSCQESVVVVAVDKQSNVRLRRVLLHLNVVVSNAIELLISFGSTKKKFGIMFGRNFRLKLEDIANNNCNSIAEEKKILFMFKACGNRKQSAFEQMKTEIIKP
jgi:hypothetical protein